VLFGCLSEPSISAPFASLQWWRHVRWSHQVLGDLYNKVYDNIRAKGTPADDDTTLAACFARLTQPSTGKLFTKEELVPEIAIFVAAGFETTSHQVGLLLYHIARRPEVQQRIKDELRTFGLLKEGGATAR
jgi:cytochrome P450